MNTMQPYEVSKAIYCAPQIDVIRFSFADIIATSENGDENQGEWDPQVIDDYPIW